MNRAMRLLRMSLAKSAVEEIRVPRALALASAGSGFASRAAVSDDGVTWVTANIPQLIWKRCANDPLRGGFVAITASAIYTSKTGKAWVAKTAPVANMTDIAVSPDGTFVVTHPNGSHYSTDGGDTWTAGDLPAGTWNRVKWIAAYSRFYTCPTGTLFYWSLDGISWTPMNNAVTSSTWSDITLIQASGFPNRLFCVSSIASGFRLVANNATTFGTAGVMLAPENPLCCEGIGSRLGVLIGVQSSGSNDIVGSPNGAATFAAIAGTGNVIKSLKYCPDWDFMIAAPSNGQLLGKAAPTSSLGSYAAITAGTMNWVDLAFGPAVQ